MSSNENKETKNFNKHLVKFFSLCMSASVFRTFWSFFFATFFYALSAVYRWGHWSQEGGGRLAGIVAGYIFIIFRLRKILPTHTPKYRKKSTRERLRT